MTGIEWPTDDAAYGLDQPATKVYDFTGPVAKAKVREFYRGIEEWEAKAAAQQAEAAAKVITAAKLSDLREYQNLRRAAGDGYLHQRHWLKDPGERSTKLANELGFDSWAEMEAAGDTGTGRQVQDWEQRPSAMRTYRHLMLSPDGGVRISDVDERTRSDIMWFCTQELADLDDQGIVRMLSDHDPAVGARKYPGAPVDDDHASTGRNMKDRTIEDVRAVWTMLCAGTPALPLEPKAIVRMRSPYGIRMSCPQLTAQVNALEKRKRDRECGQDDDVFHGGACRHTDKYASVDAVRRARKELIKDGWLTIAEDGYTTRRDHTVIGVPPAFSVPPGAGWYAYAKRAGNPQMEPAFKHRGHGILQVQERVLAA